ncbi:unnamed protein product [Penicillium roqueforti FM164]|uniref:Genomic scaffold, ProqFM164S02 n=1 Tax=Penicillium roqueforti (strain FM164) TaxID=1365484 RepID=W6Q9V7_PENRF|nr:unnamed protein product [Penicillium roqueforti FM164]
MTFAKMIEWLWSSIQSFGLWKFLLAIFLVVNLKTLPLVFHYRIFRPIIQNFLTKKRSHHVSIRCKDKNLPLVFLPCVTTTYTPLLEADYNLHKSNSTYFTDLDASRSHLLSYLCCRGVSLVDQELVAGGRRGIMAAIIGSVTTSFKMEIRIFQQYEVWSRILTWDQKWLYIVTHFVQKGSVKQIDLVTHTLSTGSISGGCARAESENSRDKPARPVIFATSVSKYVFKKGRLTVAPERLLRASGLLGESRKMGYLPAQHQGLRPRSVEATMNNINENGAIEIGQVIEKERLKGMKYANAWAELDPLHEELLGESETSDCVPTIGHFGDIAGYGISYR